MTGFGLGAKLGCGRLEGAAELARLGREDEPPEACARYSDCERAVVPRAQIGDHEHGRIARLAEAQPSRKRRVLLEVDPRMSTGIAIEPVQRGKVAIEPVERGDQAQEWRMLARLGEKGWIRRIKAVPSQELLARMAPRVAQSCAQAF